MNKNIIKLVALLFFSCSLLSASAQVGVIDSKKIFESMPIIKKLDTMVAVEQFKYQKEYNDKNTKFQEAFKIADSFYKKNPNGPVTKTLVENAQRLNDDLKDFEKMASSKIQEYKAKLFQPHYDKVNVAVKAIAIKKGVKQVMDVQANSFVYVDISTDITEDVIKQMNQ